MFQPRTILFPTDGSSSAEHARTYAAALARRFDVDLHVLLVVPFGPVDFAFDLPALSEADVAPDLDLPTPEPTGHVRRTVEVERHASAVGPAIVAYAEEVGAGLIVMGTHGRRGIRRLLLGSTAEDVLHRAACPVLLVSPEAASAFGEGRVLVADALASPSDRAVETARAIARALGNGLDVLHVVEDTEDVDIPSPYEVLAATPFDYAAVANRAAETIRAREKEASSETPARVFVKVGDPIRRVLTHAEKHGASLIVMGSHGRKGIDRVLLGSVAEGVTRRALCPVLVVRVGTGANGEAADPVEAAAVNSA